MRFQELINLCDKELRSGKTREVQQRMSALDFANVPREWRVPLAQICRRANLFVAGLCLLRPLFYQGKNQWHDRATPTEICEYAALLSKNGNNEEALRMLSHIPVNLVPQAALYTAFCHMAKWDYACGANELLRYLHTCPPAYQALLARVNLAACQVNNGEWEAARENLMGIISVCEREGHLRLLANARELNGQLHLHQRDWNGARAQLNQAAELLGSDTTYDRLFIEKWNAILNGLELGSELPILSFREKARTLDHWESVRDSDRFALMIRFDSERFDFLYFGTPYEIYRQRLILSLGKKPAAFLYRWGAGTEWKLDLSAGTLNGEPVPSGTVRVLSALLNDFYRPLSIGGLFSQLFPGDHFDPLSSAHRVHQTIWRTRKWLAANGVPLRLSALRNSIRIAPAPQVSILIPLHRSDPETVWISRLRQEFGDQEFTASEVCQVQHISRPNFQRKIRRCLKKNMVGKRFSGRATRYRVL